MAESDAGGAGDAGRSSAAAKEPKKEMALEDDPSTDVKYIPPTEKRLQEMGPPNSRKVPVVCSVIRRSVMEREEEQMDKELKALGLWEEDLTEDQKKELLRVIADSKETAEREEAARKGHFSRPTASSDAARETWDKKDQPVGFVKPSISAPEPPDSDDDDWPGSSGNQSRRSTAKPSKRTPATQHVNSMDQPVHFIWDLEDSSDDLYDIRSRYEGTGARPKERRPPPRPLSPRPLSPRPRSPTPGAMAASGSSPPQVHGDLWDTTGIIFSWDTLHTAIRNRQSSPDLPVRPWGHTRDSSPIGAQEGNNQDPDGPNKESTDEGADPDGATEERGATGGHA